MTKDAFYPPIEPNTSGYLKVSDSPPHEIYWAEYGNPGGAPVFFFHGGPGGGCSPDYARFFDPQHYRIILFDQRGAGKSKPFAGLEDNTTPHLIEDIIKLRAHLNVTGKMHVFGGSWGSTLALAYAITHPETVKSLTVRGIFLSRKEDIDFFYQGDAADPGNPALRGTGRFFPEAWAQFVEFIPENERHDMVAAYHKRLTGADTALQLEAAKRWSIWEGATSYLVPKADELDQGKWSDPGFALPFARIENHYFMNGGWLAGAGRRDQNFILENIEKIADIPTVIVHGRYDLVCPRNQADSLYAAWQKLRPGSSVWSPPQITNDAGHSQMEPGTKASLVAATDRFRALDAAPAVPMPPKP